MTKAEAISDQQAYFNSQVLLKLLSQMLQIWGSSAGLGLLREGKEQLPDCNLVEDDEWLVDVDVVHGRGDGADMVSTEIELGNLWVWILGWFGLVV